MRQLQYDSESGRFVETVDLPKLVFPSDIKRPVFVEKKTRDDYSKKDQKILDKSFIVPAEARLTMLSDDEKREREIIKRSATEAFKAFIPMNSEIKQLWNPKTFPQYKLPNFIKFDPVLWGFFKRLHYQDKNFIAVVVGETGCQPGTDKVLTRAGWKFFKDVKKSDIIKSIDVKSGKVIDSNINTINVYSTPNIFQVCDVAGAVLYECTEFHKIPILKNNKIVNVEAKNISTGKTIFTSPAGVFGYKDICIKKIRRQSDVYGLDIDSDSKLYFTNDFMISHNSGKSITALSLARAIDITPLEDGRFIRNFVLKMGANGKASSDTRVVFGPSDFLKLVKSGLPRGSVIVWDEAGIGQDATQWMDKKSRLIKHVFQTFRSRNYGVFMTVPDKESITLSTRRLVHCYIDVTKRDDKFAYLDIRWVARSRGNERTDTFYKYPVFRDPISGKLQKIVRYKVPKIAYNIERVYNSIKDNTLQNMYEYYQKEMEFMERELGEATGDGPSTAIKLKKFNIAACSDVLKNRMDDVRDSDNSFSEAKVMFTLSKSGYDCNKAQAKLVIDLLRDYDDLATS